jgi:transcriptional regulator with XRE-family HTH domain
MVLRETENDFAYLLRHFRLEAGLSQEVLAERASISIQAISALERRVRVRPYRHTVERLAEALNLSDPQRAQFEDAARATSPRVRRAPVQPPGGYDEATLQVLLQAVYAQLRVVLDASAGAA